jgi:hypothetical protein
MRDSTPKSLLFLALLAVLLPGCDFFFGQQPDDDDPPPPASLECGGSFDVTNMASGELVPVTASSGTSIRISTHFASGFEDSAGILVFDDGTYANNHGEFWDPTTGERVLTGSRRHDETAAVRLFVPGGGTTAGSLQMTCSSPGEECNNLWDDDGDELQDCADPDCARYDDCAGDQEDLEDVSFLCTGDESGELAVPLLDQFSDQRTLYLSRPGGEDQPAVEFWGGAELAILGGADDLIGVEVGFGSAGFVCSGIALSDAVECTQSWRVEAGETINFPANQLPLWLEPLDTAWTSLTATVDCAD